jgi:hypothetical protein
MWQRLDVTGTGAFDPSRTVQMKDERYWAAGAPAGSSGRKQVYLATLPPLEAEQLTGGECGEIRLRAGMQLGDSTSLGLAEWAVVQHDRVPGPTPPSGRELVRQLCPRDSLRQQRVRSRHQCCRATRHRAMVRRFAVRY